MPTYIHKDNNDKMYISYDASGNKLKQEVKTAQGYITNKREYIGSLVFAEDTLDYITTSYGRIKNGKREYFITDHLGNVRTIVDEDKKVLEKNNYYPYGLVITADNMQTGNRQKFQQKERISELDIEVYDFSARYFDPVIVNTWQLDPEANKYYDLSPYSFLGNNPLKFVDPDGKMSILLIGPGDLFKTKVEVANDFAKYYNGTSISMSREFGSAIYKNKDGTFSYNVGYIGSQNKTYINENIPKNTTREGAIHSHGSEDPGYDNNNFSPGDKRVAESIGQNEYVVTPSGQLKEYDVKTKTVNEPTGASKDIPSDKNSGDKRVNNVEAKDTKPEYIDPKTNTIHNEREKKIQGYKEF